MAHYDFIIIGAGASGLMLADALGRDVFFSDKSVLLLDKDAKKSNDRTWCFWEKGKGLFDDIASYTWNHIYFGGREFSKRLNIDPYTYKMVRGVDFYASYLKRIQEYPNITFRQEKVSGVSDYGNRVHVVTDTGEYFASKVFSSLFDYEMATHQKKYPVLQQHFVGWTVRTEVPIFKADQVTYMDFSIPQKGNTRFMYVLPFSETEALVEYTLFSKDLLRKEEYESAIRDYVKGLLDDYDHKMSADIEKQALSQAKVYENGSKGENLKPEYRDAERIATQKGYGNYEILETEQGSIPMTCYDFREHHTPNIRYIGTAGGWAKPSTGYTFRSTSKKVPVLIDYLKTGQPLDRLNFKNKFWYYDLLFLDVLFENNGEGHQIFETLFKNRDPQLIFKFLDEQTTFVEDLNYIMGCPKWPFIKALLGRIF